MRKLTLCILILLGTSLSFAQPPKNLTLLGSLNFPNEKAAGCWHYNRAGKEYAIVGMSEGIAIVDISQPSSPQTLFRIPGVSSIWHEVKVSGDYAYAVSEGRDQNSSGVGVQIIDLSNLPNSAPFVNFKGEGAVAGQIETAHTITTEGNLLFVNGHNIGSLGNGILIFDISSPMSPVYLGAVTSNYCHDSFVRGTFLVSSEIRAGQFSIFDISNPAAPQILATQTTPGLFNHNTWLNDAGTVLFSTDEIGGKPLAAYDITDLFNITLIDTFYNTNFAANEVHNVRVLNDFLINPSYGSQLTLADASRPHNIIEIGNFTTGNSLCWDADPFTQSGNIIATDMNSGDLFIFQPNYVRACYLEGTITDSLTGNAIPLANVTFTSTGLQATADLSGNYATGIADSGTYNVTYSANGYFPVTYTVSLNNGVLVTKNAKMVSTFISVDQLHSSIDKLFPNPANDVISFQTEKEISSYEIIDSKGAGVLSGEVKSDKIISITSLPAGNYYFQGYSQKDAKLVLPFLKN